ncbi:cell cycle checkpoint protein RAD17 [Golovinomyces cichoracearum]|uniref:Cell cycle checkpoint protein RAD17 n=1 Tax=Golovinomyces cichoracearum TaxID=62708 RepID=A0A420IHG2_9PEZI|nr:cell cycle checkpoint protein RAD17 [Golovinomyces cichoracearum]
MDYSLPAHFDEFLGKSGRFRHLDLFSSQESVSTKRKDELPDARRGMMLIEKFPSTFASSSLILQSFQHSLLKYLTYSTTSLFTNSNKPTNSTVPIVIIFSESPLTTFNSADNFTAHRLLGPLKKTPGQMVLKKLGETGDIRGAAGSLEFLRLRGDTDGDCSARVSFGRSKSKNKEITMTKMEKESLELINRRDVSSGNFHAVVSVNKLMDEIGTDVHTFIVALHENYLLSCDAASSSFKFSSLDHRAREKMKSIIDLWISRLQNGIQDSTRRIMEDMNNSKMNYGIVETWKSPQSKSTKGVTNTVSFAMVSNISRKEILLERLPYMAKILNFKRTTSSIIATKEIEKVTTFADIGSIKELLDANHDTEIEDKRWISN